MYRNTIDTKGTATQADDEYIGGTDCEGNNLNFPLASGRQVIVERYFLRKDANNTTDEPNQPLALACDAGYYPLTVIQLLSRVMGMRVKL